MTTSRKRAGAKAISALLVRLTTSGGDYTALEEASGLSHETVAAWIKEMRNATPRLVFIGTWIADQRGYMTIPVFHWGPYQDVPRPAKPAKQRVAEYRARKELP